MNILFYDEPGEERFDGLANGRNGRIVKPVNTFEHILTFLSLTGAEIFTLLFMRIYSNQSQSDEVE